MINRLNKITALIVAATSIISVTPAFAKADRLTYSDGDVSKAIPYKDGKYLYEGSKDGKEYGVYYNDGNDNETLLSDVSDLDDAVKYEDGYVVVPDSKDETKINLSDGSIATDEDSRDDKLVYAREKLKNKLAKTKRYGEDTEIKSFKSISDDTNMFGNDEWYEYTATGDPNYADAVVEDDDTTDGSGSTSGDEEQAKSQITVTVRGIWGACTIGGVEFSNIYSVEALETAIKATSFTGYAVKSTEITADSGGSQVLTIVFTTTEDLGTTVPDGFITGLSDWSNGYAEAVASPYVAESTEPKSQITVTVRGIWGPCTIGGISFSNIYSVEALETAIKAASFTGYTVESTAIDSSSGSDVLTIIFTTAEDLGTTVPDGFVTGLSDWSNGYAEAVASPYVATEDDSTTDDTTTDDNEEEVIYYGYTDGNGNYIDCSKIANFKVFNGEKSVKLENFNDKKVTKSEDGDSKLKVKIGLPTVVATLGQDENYIYSLIDVPIIGSQPENGSSYSEDAEVNVRYVQKVSKKQQGKVAGAFLPSDVSSYQLNNNTGWDEGDNWAYMAAYYLIQDSLDEFDGNSGIRIIDGNIYVAKSSTDDDGDPSVSFGKLKLKSGAKVTLINDDNRVIGEPLVFEDFANDTKANDWCIDVNGNVWAIYNGKIKKSAQGRAFQDTYRADGTLNKISVYDDENLVAWDDEGDYYSTAKDIKIQSSKLTTTDIKTGWQKAEDGSWHLYDLSGNESKGWINYNSTWYYFNEQGVMQTGWVQVDGKSYYLSASGTRVIGWKEIDGKWYYFDENGVKQVNTTINGYTLDTDGVWVK